MVTCETRREERGKEREGEREREREGGRERERKKERETLRRSYCFVFTRYQSNRSLLYRISCLQLTEHLERVSEMLRFVSCGCVFDFVGVCALGRTL